MWCCWKTRSRVKRRSYSVLDFLVMLKGRSLANGAVRASPGSPQFGWLEAHDHAQLPEFILLDCSVGHWEGERPLSVLVKVLILWSGEHHLVAAREGCLAYTFWEGTISTSAEHNTPRQGSKTSSKGTAQPSMRPLTKERLP